MLINDWLKVCQSEVPSCFQQSSYWEHGHVWQRKSTCGTGKQNIQYTVSVSSHPTHRYWGRREGEAAGNFFFLQFSLFPTSALSVCSHAGCLPPAVGKPSLGNWGSTLNLVNSCLRCTAHIARVLLFLVPRSGILQPICMRLNSKTHLQLLYFFIHVGKHLTRRKKERNFVFEKMHKPETAGTFGKSKPGFYHQVRVIFTIFCFQSPAGSENCLFTGIWKNQESHSVSWQS